MKKYLLLLLLTPLIAPSQDCKTYFFLQNNKTIEMSIYNKKGDLVGKQVYKVSDFKLSGPGSSATLNTQMIDKKGKTIMTGLNQIQCKNGVIMMDMKMNIPQTTAFNSANAKSDVYIEYPSVMTVGETLKAGHMQMDVDNNGLQQSITIDVENRKVQGKQTVTSPAGSWECFKITNTTKMKINTMGIGIPINMEVTEWFAPGAGIIKTESRSGQTLITAIY